MAKILVVDDDQDILSFAEALLAQANHQVKTASNVLLAIELLNAERFDALLSDVNMPNYSGFELLQTIKSNKNFDHMAVALLTGVREKKSIEKAIKFGVDDYIVKPIDPLLFIKKVESLFHKKPIQELPAVHFTANHSLSSATLTVDISLASISEEGLTIYSKYDFAEGKSLQIESNLFKEIGVPTPNLKVYSSRKRDGQFEIKLDFIGIKENSLEKIRAWVFKEIIKQRKHSA